MIFLRIECYFYYLSFLTLVVWELIDQQDDPEPDSIEQSSLVLLNGVFICHLGRARITLTQ